MDNELQQIGYRVKQARISNHLTQQQLAENTGISTSFLCNIENGRQSMDLRIFIALTNALNVSADWLIKGNPLTSSRINEMIEKELSSCSTKEREAILQLIQQMKKTIVSLKSTSDE